MPEVVSCPKCQRKSRVPDTLIGKKVKCPGCAEIFTANVKGPAAPKKEAEVKKKPDDDDEEGETYEVVSDRKKRRSDDDEDEDERVSDKPRARRRTEDDEDDDKPRKSRRGRDDDDEDDEDDDDRVSTRRRRISRDDDDDDDDDDRGGGVSRKPALKADWTRVRMGLSLLLASVLTTIGVLILSYVGMFCIIRTVMPAGWGGPPPNFAAAGTASFVVGGVALLGRFAAWLLKVGGSVLCLPSPTAFASRTLALVGLVLLGIEALLTILQMGINLVANGMQGIMAMVGNPMMGGGLGGPPAGAGGMVGQLIVGLLGSVIWIGWLFVIGFYIRSLGLCLRNYSLAGSAKGWLITLGITMGLGLIMVIAAFATIGLVALNFANQMGAANAGKPQGPGAAGGLMAGAGLLMCGLGCIDGLLGLVLLVWYIIMLAQARGSITGRMTR